jgi:cytochrome c oxidase subunit II
MPICSNSCVLLRRACKACAGFAVASAHANAALPASSFSPHSTPASEINSLSLFVWVITGLIFVGVSALLVYALIKFRARPDDSTEPPQVFGSLQIELSWTIIPILIIVVLFLTTARVLFSIQDAPEPQDALEVTVIGHQFWWEFRYPKNGVVTANELHVPLSSPSHPRPTYMKLTSADVMHSFWVPQLAGKTDLLPNRVNEMWIDPQQPGIYVGQCAQFCGPQHAKMLLRVYVDTPEQFKAWIANQQRQQEELKPAVPMLVSLPNEGNDGAASRIPPNSPVQGGDVATPAQENSDAIDVHNGQHIFEQQSCISCHTISGTIANGRYGPDLTHLMSRETIGAGAALNTPGNLEAWVADPNTFKPGCLMPEMHLTDRQNQQITAYLLTLK